MSIASTSQFTYRIRFWARQYLVTILGFLVGLAVWELWVRVTQTPAFLLPTPSKVIETMVVEHAVLLQNAWVTLYEILVGFAAGAFVGFVLAVAIIFSPILERLIYPFSIIAQVIPKVAIAPLLVVWFGFGMLPKVLIIAVMCMFPILINVLAGMRLVDSRLLELMLSISATQWQVFWKVRLPHARPHLFAGFKIAIPLAVVGAVVSEWIGADSGLGQQMLVAHSRLRTDLLFADFVLLSLLGIGLFGMVVGLERLVLSRNGGLEVTRFLG